ncbi:MAG: double zinc ribbon domain-containing protein [Thermoplasmatota archaeon]
MAEEHKICPVCDSEVPIDADVCQDCGMDLSLSDDFEEVIMFECPICGAEVSEDAVECPNCGAIFEEEETEDRLEEEVRGGIDELERLFDEVKETRLDTTVFEKNMQTLSNMAKEERYEESVELIDKLLDTGEKILDTENILSGIDKRIDDFSDNIEVSSYKDELDKVINLSKEGDYSEAYSLSLEILNDLDKDSKSKFVELEKEAEKKLNQARKGLAKARETKLSIDFLKDMVREAVQARGSDDFQKSIRKSEKIVTLSEKITEVYGLILEGKKKLKELKDKGGDYKHYLKDLKEGKIKAEEGMVDEALDILKGSKDEITTVLEKTETKNEEAKDTAEDISILFEEKMKEARKKLKTARETNIDESYLKSIIREALDHKKEANFERGLKKLEELNESYERLMEASNKLESVKDKLQELRQNELEYKDVLPDLREGKNTADKGDFVKAAKIFDEIISKLVDRLKEKEEGEEDSVEEGMKKVEYVSEAEEDLTEEGIEIEVEQEITEIEEKDELVESEPEITEKKEEPAEEELEMEVAAEVIDELQETESDVVESDEEIEKIVEKELKEAEEMISQAIESEEEIGEVSEEEKEEIEISIHEIERKVSEIRSLLITARNYGIPIEKGREMIDRALKSTEQKDFKSGYKFLEKGEEKLKSDLDKKIEDKIMNLELSVEEAKEEDKEVEISERYLERAKQEYQDKNYKKLMELLAQAEESLGEAESYESIVEDKITLAEDIIFDADRLGLNVNDIKNILKKADERYKNQDLEEAEILAEKAREKTLKKIPGMLDQHLEKAQKELTKEKIVGTDVSRPIDLLKQANLACKNQNYEDCLYYLKLYEQEMESIRG